MVSSRVPGSTTMAGVDSWVGRPSARKVVRSPGRVRTQRGPTMRASASASDGVARVER